MKKKEEKITRAAHIKRHTRGTSNEISLSVLDAAKNAADGERRDHARPRFPLLGVISLFTLKAKKPVSTPTKEKGLPLSTGEFVSTDSSAPVSSSTPQTVPGIAADSASATLTSASVSSVKAAAGESSSSSGSSLASAGLSSVADGARGAVGSASTSASTRAAASARPAASSWETPVEEVARRKAVRMRGKRLMVAAGVLGAAILIAVGVNFVYGSYQHAQEMRSGLAGLIQSIDEPDEVVLALDERIQSIEGGTLEQIAAGEDSEATATEAPTARQLDEAKTQLEEIKASIEALQSSIADASDVETSNRALIAINARLNMIEAGNSILSTTTDLLQAYEKAQEGWNLLIEGDSLTRDAATLIAETSPENTLASSEISTEAITTFSQARESLSAAYNLCPDVDLSAFLDYIDLRIDAQEQALASNQAYLERSKERASEANEAYNNLEAEAASLVRNQKSDPISLFEKYFEQAIASNVATYDTERARASEADAFLRDYLGIR